MAIDNAPNIADIVTAVATAISAPVAMVMAYLTWRQQQRVVRFNHVGYWREERGELVRLELRLVIRNGADDVVQPRTARIEGGAIYLFWMSGTESESETTPLVRDLARWEIAPGESTSLEAVIAPDWEKWRRQRLDLLPLREYWNAVRGRAVRTRPLRVRFDFVLLSEPRRHVRHTVRIPISEHRIAQFASAKGVGVGR